MSKFIPILILILIIGFTVYQAGIEPLEKLLLIFEKPEEKEVPTEEKKPEEIIPEEEFTPSDRAETFYITGGKTFPVFTKEVTVDPFKVKEGEEQTFSIWAKDPKGIEDVKAIIVTDSREELIQLELVEGTKEEGRWIASWITKNISALPTYSTKFQAANSEGEVTKMTLFWQVEEITE